MSKRDQIGGVVRRFAIDITSRIWHFEITTAMYDFVARVGKTCIAFGQNTFHSNEKRAFDFEVASLSVVCGGRTHAQQLIEFFVVRWMYVLVNTIACQLDLREAQMDWSGFGYVHDFAFFVDHKQESVQCLSRKREKMFSKYSWNDCEKWILPEANEILFRVRLAFVCHCMLPTCYSNLVLNKIQFLHFYANIGLFLSSFFFLNSRKQRSSFLSFFCLSCLFSGFHKEKERNKIWIFKYLLIIIFSI